MMMGNDNFLAMSTISFIYNFILFMILILNLRPMPDYFFLPDNFSLDHVWKKPHERMVTKNRDVMPLLRAFLTLEYMLSIRTPANA